jgi:hypothetical protein
LKGELRRTITTKLLKSFNNLNSSSVALYNYKYGTTITTKWSKLRLSNYTKLSVISREISIDENAEVKKLVLDVFSNVLVPSDLDGNDFNDYIDYYLNSKMNIHMTKN